MRRLIQQVAIKKIELTTQNVKLITAEIHIMSESCHDNVVKYYDTHRVDRELWVVMEYLEGGCLTDILELHEDIQMGEGHIAWACQQVCNTPLCSFILLELK